MSRARFNPLGRNAFTLRQFPSGNVHIAHRHQRPEAANGLRSVMQHERYPTVLRLTGELHPNERTICVPHASDGKCTGTPDQGAPAETCDHEVRLSEALLHRSG